MLLIQLLKNIYSCPAHTQLPEFFSCKKEASEPSSPAVSETEAAEYSAEGMETEASYDDVQDISMTAADEEGILSAGRAEGLRPFPFLKLRVRIGAKAVITVTPDDNTYPKTVTIDFGEGYICPDAKFRKGKNCFAFHRSFASTRISGYYHVG